MALENVVQGREELGQAQLSKGIDQLCSYIDRRLETNKNKQSFEMDSMGRNIVLLLREIRIPSTDHCYLAQTYTVSSIQP